MIDQIRYAFWQKQEKTRKNNDVTNCIGLVYVKIEIELLGPIWLGVVFEKNQRVKQRG